MAGVDNNVNKLSTTAFIGGPWPRPNGSTKPGNIDFSTASAVEGKASNLHGSLRRMIRNDPERIRTFLREREAVTAAASLRNNRTKRTKRKLRRKQKGTRSKFSAENIEETLRFAERFGQVCHKLMSISKYLKGSPRDQVAELRKNKHAFDTFLTPEEQKVVHENHELIIDVLEIYSTN
jgi:hypothetical protein